MKELLYNWGDEIPKQIIHNEGNFKVRNNWFQIAYGWLSIAEKADLLKENVIKDYHDFERYMELQKDLRRKNGNSKEDIQRGNKLLEDAIKCLEEIN